MVAFVLITQFESENGAEAVVMKSPDNKRFVEVVQFCGRLGRVTLSKFSENGKNCICDSAAEQVSARKRKNTETRINLPCLQIDKHISAAREAADYVTSFFRPRFGLNSKLFQLLFPYRGRESIRVCRGNFLHP